MQASLLVPFDRGGKTGARALPVRFECAPVPKRPGKRAGDAEREQYEQARKRCRISQRLVDMMAPLRAALDAAGGIAKKMVLRFEDSVMETDKIQPAYLLTASDVMERDGGPEATVLAVAAYSALLLASLLGFDV